MTANNYTDSANEVIKGPVKFIEWGKIAVFIFTLENSCFTLDLLHQNCSKFLTCLGSFYIGLSKNISEQVQNE